MKQSKLRESTEITVHGSTYKEDESYPFQICPECLNDRTKIVNKPNYEWCSRGLFVYKKIHVVHKCEDCGCKWIHTYMENDHSRIVDKDVSAAIISFITSVLSIFSFVCSLSCDPSNKIVAAWSGISIMASLLSIAIFLFCISEVFGND